MNEYLNSFYADKQRKMNGHALKYVKFMRKCQYCRSALVRKGYQLLLNRLSSRYGLEIPWRCKIGKGLYLGHAYNITINPNAIIGEWCNIHKGVTIGQQNRGSRIGAPIIGNFVWIGANATIVGKVTIGNDVLIAPGAFVNVDVPDHSVVIGNPCSVHHKDNATKGYINNVSGE